jgi:hypothetical protein
MKTLSISNAVKSLRTSDRDKMHVLAPENENVLEVIPYLSTVKYIEKYGSNVSDNDRGEGKEIRLGNNVLKVFTSKQGSKYLRLAPDPCGLSDATSATITEAPEISSEEIAEFIMKYKFAKSALSSQRKAYKESQNKPQILIGF